MKILLLDIETAPNTVYTWGLFKQNIAINQIESPGYILCWAAKWLGNEQMYFSSIRKGQTNMLKYRRYRCNGCGGWFRSNKTISTRREERMANIAA